MCNALELDVRQCVRSARETGMLERCDVGIEIFEQTDFVFLSEYVRIMIAIANALDLTSSTLRFRLPTLLAVQSKLK